MYDGDIEAFERSVRGDSVVESLTNLDGQVNATLYRMQWTEEVDGFLDALLTHEMLVSCAQTVVPNS